MHPARHRENKPETLASGDPKMGCRSPNLVALVGSLVEGQGAADPSIFATLFEVALAEMSQGAATGEIATSPSLARLMITLHDEAHAVSILY